MKQFGSLFLFVFYTLLGFLIPEYADTSVFITAFLNLTGVASIVVIITEAIKKLIKYNSETAWNWWPIIISGGVSVGLGFFASQFNIPGVYADMIAWYEVVITSIVVTGLANRAYDSDFAYALIRIILKKDIPVIEQPNT